MVYKSGIVAVGTTPVAVYDPVESGYIVVQNQGTQTAVATYVGGSAHAAGGGISLQPGANTAAGGLPVAIPVAHYGEFTDADDALYGWTSSGTSSVAFVAST
jgi:hypothetical protein